MMVSQRRASDASPASQSPAELGPAATPASKPGAPTLEALSTEIDQLRATLRQVLNVSVYDAAGRVRPVGSILRGSLATVVRAVTSRS